MGITDSSGGHGHVVPRADGMAARCGGPGLCAACTAEAGHLREELGKLRGDLQVALGLTGSPDDAAIIQAAHDALADSEMLRAENERLAISADHEEGEAEKARQDAKATGEQLSDLQAALTKALGLPLLPGDVYPADADLVKAVEELATSTTEGDLAALRASLEEARAAEQRECERAEKAERALAVERASSAEDANDAMRARNLLRGRIRELEAKIAHLERSMRHIEIPGQHAAEAVAFKKRAEKAERYVEKLREELTAMRRQELKDELDASFVERYENARRQAEEARREAAKANEERIVAVERLRTKDRALMELHGRMAELGADFEELKTDRQHAAADALRARLRRVEALSANRLRRWEESCGEVERLRDELARRPLNPIDLDALRKIGEPGNPAHTCSCAKPAMQVAPEPPCLFCRHGGPDFAEGGCSRPEAPRRQGIACLDFEPPEPARREIAPSCCAGSGAPPGALDGRGRYRCPECDFSTPITPKALEALPEHPPADACGERP